MSTEEFDGSRICLFCKSVVANIASTSEWNRNFSIKVSTEYVCITCHQNYTLVGLEDEEPDSLQFNCKEITVFVYYKTNFIALQVKAKDIVYLPKFDIDFSDMEKLYNKLSTYLLFS